MVLENRKGCLTCISQAAGRNDTRRRFSREFTANFGVETILRDKTIYGIAAPAIHPNQVNQRRQAAGRRHEACLIHGARRRH